MSFGRNPHVAKAQAAEQKAQLAKDNSARTLAWREAARQWERASERENSDAKKQDYAARAREARDQADGVANEDTANPAFAAPATQAEQDRQAGLDLDAEPTEPNVAGPARWLN